ncbi:MAG: FHA domain-containing protein [Myxococcus sp.]|nr:FHA domain-containing protein [Myxococcus sp.]
MKSYLLSALRRTGAAGREAFNKQHPGDWLVWEPGTWKAPRASTMVLDTLEDPRLVAPPKGAEGLAIALPTQPRVTVGRSHEVDVSLNDGTLSAQHLSLLRTSEGRWSIEDLGSTNGTTVEGLKLKAGDRMTLRNGSAIKAGQVTLTFQTSEGMWQRLVP